MSINTLTVDNPDKSWANLYVNSMTVYNDLEVRGNITNTGSVSGDVTHEDNVLIKGKLTLDNSNNPASEAIEITGAKDLKTDGDILFRDGEASRDMIVDGELQMSNSNNTNPQNYSINVVGNYKIHTDGQLEGQRLLLDPANPAAVPLDKFEEYTGQLTMGGPFADIPTDYYAAKFGTSGEYFVILEVKDVLLQAYNLSSTWIRSQNTLPSAIVPTIGTSIQGTCVIENGGTKSVGTYFIEDLGSGGELKIYAGLNNDLFTGGPISFFTLYITYRV